VNPVHAIKTLLPAGLVLLALLLSSCVSLIDATTSTPIAAEPGERSFGNYIDDKRIETVVAVNLRKADPELRAAHISVISFNGVVLLVGQVATSNHRDQAADIAQAVQEVRQVHNELTVSGAISLLARTNDSWLTAKIKTKFIFKGGLDSGRIKIVTENGVVYLMGLMTHAEADTAVDVARNSSGIQKIVRVFEYID
jgi:osmotically-inducible protein OsmY